MLDKFTNFVLSLSHPGCTCTLGGRPKLKLENYLILHHLESPQLKQRISEWANFLKFGQVVLEVLEFQCSSPKKGVFRQNIEGTQVALTVMFIQHRFSLKNQVSWLVSQYFFNFYKFLEHRRQKNSRFFLRNILLHIPAAQLHAFQLLF